MCFILKVNIWRKERIFNKIIEDKKETFEDTLTVGIHEEKVNVINIG